ncbi:hypothetical protein MAP00_004892 [Monascus purpureus]|nr:hypothetical protein MAP00_004892 [Monascus purpureus]
MRRVWSSLLPATRSLSIVLRFDICPRINTVEKIAELLNEHKLIHIRGTPSSGKTTFSRLLRVGKGNKVKRVSAQGDFVKAFVCVNKNDCYGTISFNVEDPCAIFMPLW